MKSNYGYGYGMRPSRMQNPNGCERMDCPGNCESQRNPFPIGMCYVPMQKWGNLFEADEGLAHGTIFRDLALPFTCAGCTRCHDRRQVRR
ncbi:MAG: spore coat associated protein CotJA [Clostridiales bacterium]|nr:spore coat associated protein CotJA [Clostridiales bacterium]